MATNKALDANQDFRKFAQSLRSAYGIAASITSSLPLFLYLSQTTRKEWASLPPIMSFASVCGVLALYSLRHQLLSALQTLSSKLATLAIMFIVGMGGMVTLLLTVFYLPALHSTLRFVIAFSSGIVGTTFAVAVLILLGLFQYSEVAANIQGQLREIQEQYFEAEKAYTTRLGKELLKRHTARALREVQFVLDKATKGVVDEPIHYREADYKQTLLHIYQHAEVSVRATSMQFYVQKVWLGDDDSSFADLLLDANRHLAEIRDGSVERIFSVSSEYLKSSQFHDEVKKQLRSHVRVFVLLPDDARKIGRVKDFVIVDGEIAGETIKRGDTYEGASWYLTKQKITELQTAYKQIRDASVKVDEPEDLDHLLSTRVSAATKK